MIARLKGLIDTIGDDFLIIDVNGVGYLVFASNKTLGKLSLGSPASLMIETIVREDNISLYGFFDPLEKEWFNTLTKVQGVGAKVCLAILSVLSPNQLAQAVAAQDKNSFSRANGVGPKLAARIVTELKDKIVTVPMAEISHNLKEAISFNDETAENLNYEDILIARDDDPTKMEDAISALVNLGYQRLEAYKSVNAVLSKKPDAETAELIRLALKEFAKEQVK